MTKTRTASERDARATTAKAEEMAHERIDPNLWADPIVAVNLYVEAFEAGAAFAKKDQSR